MIPTATYRLSFVNGMTFDRAAALVCLTLKIWVSAIFMPHPSLPLPVLSTHGAMSPMRMRLSLLRRARRIWCDWRPELKAQGVGWGLDHRYCANRYGQLAGKRPAALALQYGKGEPLRAPFRY
ncbi:hypothetical protein KCP77_14670 [Salmonella enterica subsp. enterica]|nr:hypothetical protein KCP77_14670 [Salmonella enterica subsp. enterica]